MRLSLIRGVPFLPGVMMSHKVLRPSLSARSRTLITCLVRKNVDCQIQHFSGLDTPVLQLVQFRDTEGMVTDRFKKAADGVMCLAAADFNEVMKPEDGYNWWFETTQADITVEYSPLHKESWTEFTVDERPEWATRELGYVYEASLKDVHSPEYSGWYCTGAHKNSALCR